MTLPDAINGSFETLAGLMIGNHCRTLYRDKQVRGVSLLSTCFFGAWGIWNLYYYPHLGQILSFLGGLSVSSANALWIGMMIHYRRREQRLARATWIKPSFLEPPKCDHETWIITPDGQGRCADCRQIIPFTKAVNDKVARLRATAVPAPKFNHSEARNA